MALDVILDFFFFQMCQAAQDTELFQSRIVVKQILNIEKLIQTVTWSVNIINAMRYLLTGITLSLQYTRYGKSKNRRRKIDVDKWYWPTKNKFQKLLYLLAIMLLFIQIC